MSRLKKRQLIAEVRAKRVNEIYSLLGRYKRHGLTLKEVCDKAGINTKSIYANLSNLEVGDDRLDLIETTLHELITHYTREAKSVQAV